MAISYLTIVRLTLAGRAVGAFTAGMRRALGISFMRQVASIPAERASASGLLSAMRELGVGYRRQDFLRDFQTVQHSADVSPEVASTRPHDAFSPGAITETTWGRRGRYRYVGRGFFTDPETGERYQKHLTIYHSELLTPDQVSAAISESMPAWGVGAERYPVEFTAFVPTAVYHHRARAY